VHRPSKGSTPAANDQTKPSTHTTMATANDLEHFTLGSMAKMVLDCLNEHIGSEQPDTVCEIHNHTSTADDPNSWNLEQVRGFRDQLKKYYNQQNQTGRVMRVVRRLQAKNVPNELLSATAIPLAACLLLDNPRIYVKEAGMKLVRKWMQQLDGVPMLSKGGDAPSAAYEKMANALSMWQARVAHAMNDPSSETKVGNNEQGPLKVTKETFEKVTKEIFEKASGYRLMEMPPNAESATQLVSSKRPISLDKDDFVSFLGNSVEKALRHLPVEEIAAKAAKVANRHILSEKQEKSDQTIDTFDNIALVLTNTELDAAHHLSCPNHDQSWMAREFLKGAQSYLQLDDESLGLLSMDLRIFQVVVMDVFSRVAMNHVVRILGESFLSVLENRLKSLQAVLEEENGAIKPESSKDLDICKEIIEGLGKQLGHEVRLQCDDIVKSSIQFLQPIKKMLELVDPSGKLPRNLPSLLNATKEVASLRPKVNKLSADLAKSELKEQKTAESVKSFWRENVKLKKLVEVERAAMHKKYFRDIETQVEARLQSEKTTSAAYIADIEAKAKRADAAEEALTQVQDALKNVTRERDGLASRNMDLDAACKQLRADTAATERGYEQMRRAKEECEVKLVTVEADLSHTQAQLQDLQTQTLQAPVPKADENSKSQDTAQTGITVLTHREQLTAFDRLDMIAQGWRNDLSSAEDEKQELYNALRVTEDQIAVASQRLRELAPVTHFQAYHRNYNAGQSYQGTRGRASYPAAPRIPSRSLTPASDDSYATVPTRIPKRPEAAVEGPPTRRGVPAQNVSWKLLGKGPALILVQEDDEEAFPPLSMPARPVRGSPRTKILRLL
jgi:hypothetical protein